MSTPSRAHHERTYSSLQGCFFRTRQDFLWLGRRVSENTVLDLVRVTFTIPVHRCSDTGGRTGNGFVYDLQMRIVY